jgi:hypothetical protein
MVCLSFPHSIRDHKIFIQNFLPLYNVNHISSIIIEPLIPLHLYFRLISFPLIRFSRAYISLLQSLISSPQLLINIIAMGLTASIPAAVLLVLLARRHGGLWHMYGCGLYAFSLVSRPLLSLPSLSSSSLLPLLMSI